MPRLPANSSGIASAEAVAEEIRALGGEAVADTHSVATEESAAAIVQAAQQNESSPMQQYSKEQLPDARVLPVVAFLAHESCPVTGECIESVEGAVNRFYVAPTLGFTDPALTIETVAERQGEVMAEAADSIIEAVSADPNEWALKPYKTTDR